MVIAEAVKLNLPTAEIEKQTSLSSRTVSRPLGSRKPRSAASAWTNMKKPSQDADKGNKWSQYRAAKFMLDRDGDHYDPKRLWYLTGSAKQGYTVAKYMLGKLYLKGEDVPKQMLHALHWLESAVKR